MNCSFFVFFKHLLITLRLLIYISTSYHSPGFFLLTRSKKIMEFSHIFIRLKLNLVFAMMLIGSVVQPQYRARVFLSTLSFFNSGNLSFRSKENILFWKTDWASKNQQKLPGCLCCELFEHWILIIRHTYLFHPLIKNFLLLASVSLMIGINFLKQFTLFYTIYSRFLWFWSTQSSKFSLVFTPVFIHTSRSFESAFRWAVAFGESITTSHTSCWFFLVQDGISIHILCQL